MSRYASVRSLLAADFRRLRPDVRWSFARHLLAATTTPGLLASLLLRAQMLAVSRRRPRLAGLVRTFALRTIGADFVPGCVAGPGLLMHHPSGVVLGGGSVVGADCTILQQVTLGEKYADGQGPHAYPRLGDRCVVGAGAKILGGVTLGNDVVVGANSVVSASVPDGLTVVGAPARAVKASRR